jgi:tRNA-binding EMAP/Myf-like protein
MQLIVTLAEPFIPGFTEKVVHTLQLPHSNIPDTFEITIPAGHKILKPVPIFAVISNDQIEALRQRYAGSQVAGAGSGSGAAPASAAPSSAGASATPSQPAGGKGGKGGKGKATAPCPASNLPAIAQVELRVGKIVKAWPHEKVRACLCGCEYEMIITFDCPCLQSEKLWCEHIDIGEPAPRTIASGLREYYKNVSDLEGRSVVVVCNLKPRNMLGFESQGMVLCASNADHTVVEFIDLPAGTPPGTRITVPGVFEDDPATQVINPSKDGNAWGVVAKASWLVVQSRVALTPFGPGANYKREPRGYLRWPTIGGSGRTIDCAHCCWRPNQLNP